MLIHKRYVWLGVLVALGFSVTNANAKTLTFAGEQWVVKNGRFSLYVLVNIFIPPDNHDFASSRRCSFILNQAK